MINVYIFGLFLYFPEDKSEYLPAGITMFFFFLAAVAVFFLIKKVSKKEQLKAEELERAMKITNKQSHE
ncbi:hypothetical protein [Metabacillus idriensis]|uniref:hypothetical protein n=1 Tax=Metabacillus idriensis TaxID=324768 RepID=UPI00174E9BAF|nr:hypothetical protein [Metabacillus idriensis]